MAVVKVEKSEGYVMIRPVGELTEMGKLQDLKEAQEQYLDSDCRNFIINLAEVNRVDSSGLGALYGMYKRTLEAGGKMVFAAVPERLRRVLEVMNFQSVVPCMDSVEEAVRSLAKG